MKKILFGLLLITALSSTFAQRVARFYDDEVARGDMFIDDLLHDMLYDHGHEYDPYVLEDSVIGFSKKVMFVNVSGEAKLHNGYIIGLKTLHRPDHCNVREEDGKLYVTADLGAGVISCHYDGTVKFMSWGPTIRINGEVQYIETHMEFSTDARTGRNGVLHKFYIDDMKGMTVKITGLGPMNWAANYLMSGVTSIFKGFIKRMLESQIKNHIAERLPNYVFPVDNINTDVPETEAPETKAPETEVPDTEAPETTAPETEIPDTEAPETEAPETEVPDTEVPETEAPETEVPDTEVPETEAPETEENVNVEDAAFVKKTYLIR